ncbi:hypothetical protein [Dactylosporangium sp. CA-233914]|uniref:hypothetical protein n=1 Tax=Dactylosporangium sp. CA-233914 TaxID=3239934 RepID=UPI003D91DC3B
MDTFGYGNQIVGAATFIAMAMPGGLEAFAEDVAHEEERWDRSTTLGAAIVRGGNLCRRLHSEPGKHPGARAR